MLFKANLPIVERAHIISSTLHLDPAYQEPMRLLKEKYKEEGVDIDDPEEQPFHEDLSNLKVIMAGMVKRTREAQEQGDSFAPLTYLWIDDLMGAGLLDGLYGERPSAVKAKEDMDTALQNAPQEGTERGWRGDGEGCGSGGSDGYSR